jgi:RNA polymerase sigma-70 factor (ECF subfamily)
MSFQSQLPVAAETGRVEFVSTHWSLILAAGDEASPQSAEALNELCRTYWYPLYAYVRRQGFAPHEAQDLTQEFFARLMRKHDLSRVGPQKGRFRSFLLVVLRHFLVNEWEKARTEKRGGDKFSFSLDGLNAEERYALEPRQELNPENLYERKWALAILDRVLACLRQECTEAGKPAQFDHLKPFLSADSPKQPVAAVAKALVITEGAVKVAVHRLRIRYRELLRAEIARTVATAAEVEDELRHLRRVLGN